MKKLLLVLLSVNLFFHLAAQNTIKGKIIDNKSAPVIGATIQVKHTERGTFSDVSGDYSISASANDTLIFKMLGLETQEVPIQGRSVVNVTMPEALQKIPQVVVIGYGTVRKSDLTGSVATVKTADLTKIISLNPQQGLQGKVTGVQVTSSSGAPGLRSRPQFGGFSWS